MTNPAGATAGGRHRSTRVEPARRRPGRPRGGVAAADREQLLAAAEQRIRADGPAVTMAAIAEQANVTKPILYRGVGDKEALVASLAERFSDRVADTVAEAVERTAEPRDGVRAFVGAYLAAVEADRNVYVFVTSGDGNQGRSSHLADRSAGQIAERFAAAGTPGDVALVRAHAIVGMLHFVTLHWLRGPAPDREAITDQLTDLLWAGLRG